MGSPDEYWNVNVGTGLSIGEDPGKILLDLAYGYTWGSDVMGSLVPGQDVSTDAVEHQVFLSCIVHF